MVLVDIICEAEEALHLSLKHLCNGDEKAAREYADLAKTILNTHLKP